MRGGAIYFGFRCCFRRYMHLIRFFTLQIVMHVPDKRTAFVLLGENGRAGTEAFDRMKIGAEWFRVISVLSIYPGIPKP